MQHAPECPVTVSASGDMTLHNLAFAGSGQALEISIADGRIAGIDPLDTPADWVCLPPLVDKHVHANRAFTLTGQKPDSLQHAIALTGEILKNFSAEQYCAHARRLFERARTHGTTRLRTHADIDRHTRFNAVQGSVDARADMAAELDIEVVAFASSRLDPASADGRAMLKEARARGADLLGAAPALQPEPKASIDAILALAAEQDAAVDLHQDEHLAPEQVSIEWLADATIGNARQGRVTLSHGCALAVLEAPARARLIDKLARARIEVIALPSTNLYLQDRGANTPLRRGLTCVRELLDAGVEVRFASDNVCDAFYPYGDADLLDVAYIAMLAVQLDATEALVKSICDGQAALAPGARADLVLIRGSSFDDILSRRPPERIVIRRGKSAECRPGASC